MISEGQKCQLKIYIFNQASSILDSQTNALTLVSFLVLKASLKLMWTFLNLTKLKAFKLLARTSSAQKNSSSRSRCASRRLHSLKLSARTTSSFNWVPMMPNQIFKSFQHANYCLETPQERVSLVSTPLNSIRGTLAVYRFAWIQSWKNSNLNTPLCTMTYFRGRIL